MYGKETAWAWRSLFRWEKVEVGEDVMAVRSRRRTKGNKVKGKKDKLTLKQKKFAEYYIQNGGNATQAALDAEYSKKTATQIGAENLTKPYIQKYIKERLAEMDAKLVAGSTEVLKLITSVARGEIEEDTIVVMRDKTGSSVTHEPTKTTVRNRLQALTLLAKYHGLLDRDRSKENETVYQDDGLLDALNEKAEDVWKE